MTRDEDRMTAGDLFEGVLFFGTCFLIALLFLVMGA